MSKVKKSPVFYESDLPPEFLRNFNALLAEIDRWEEVEGEKDTYRHDTSVTVTGRYNDNGAINRSLHYDLGFADLPKATVYVRDSNPWSTFQRNMEKKLFRPTLEKVAVVAALAADDDLKATTRP